MGIEAKISLKCGKSTRKIYSKKTKNPKSRKICRHPFFLPGFIVQKWSTVMITFLATRYELELDIRQARVISTIRWNCWSFSFVVDFDVETGGNVRKNQFVTFICLRGRNVLLGFKIKPAVRYTSNWRRQQRQRAWIHPIAVEKIPIKLRPVSHSWRLQAWVCDGNSKYMKNIPVEEKQRRALSLKQ